MKYLLIIYIQDFKRIRVGSLGLIDLNPGCYVYIGSGGRNVYKRIDRHFRRAKKIKWHIDYLTTIVTSVKALIIWDELREEDLYDIMAEKYNFIEGFGSSDKRSRSHLFYLGFKCDVDSLIKYLYSKGIRNITYYSR